VQDLSQEKENTQDDENNDLFEASSNGKDKNQKESDLESLSNDEEDTKQQDIDQTESKSKHFTNFTIICSKQTRCNQCSIN
jgi:hypothetical protein